MSRKALGAGGRWLQSWQSGITDPASGPVRAETWPEGREKGDGAAAFGALPQLLSPGVLQHTRDGGTGVAFRSRSVWVSRAYPAAGCWDIRKGHGLQPGAAEPPSLCPAETGLGCTPS